MTGISGEYGAQCDRCHTRRFLERRADSIGMTIATAHRGWIAAARWAIGRIACCLALGVLERAAAAAAPPITVPFDHLSTGFELDGVHRDLPCESCHLNAVFKGTPRNCGICHITGSIFNATPKTADAYPEHEQLRGLPRHDRRSGPTCISITREVMGSCVSCHNGTIAQGEGTDPSGRPATRAKPAIR